MRINISLKLLLILAIFIVLAIYFGAAQILNRCHTSGFFICNFNDYRNLFSVISPVISSMIGVTGLVLGYYYYKDKTKNDEIQKTIKKMNGNLALLYDNYSIIDDNIQLLFKKNLRTTVNLESIRELVLKKFDDINILLELNGEIIGLTDHELNELIRIYSYIDKNEMLMHTPLKAFKKADFTETIYNFSIQMKNIKKILLRKLT
jgi:uncharacterized membrane protein YciS (DUF1049 family)